MKRLSKSRYTTYCQCPINSKTKIVKNSHTRKEILENEFSELWNRALEATKKLIGLQNHLAETLLNSKAVIPDSFDKQGYDEAERNLLTHIYLLSLFSFANKVAQMIEKQCKTLAENNDRDETEDAECKLKRTLDTFDAIPWEELMQDHNTGVLRLNELKERFKEKMDWNVIVNDSNQWSFRDTIRNIASFGLKYEPLWKNAIEFPIPAKSTIVPLLTNDDEMIRIY